MSAFLIGRLRLGALTVCSADNTPLKVAAGEKPGGQPKGCADGRTDQDHLRTYPGSPAETLHD